MKSWRRFRVIIPFATFQEIIISVITYKIPVNIRSKCLRLVSKCREIREKAEIRATVLLIVLKSYGMGDRGWADVEIPVGGKQGRIPVCEFLLFVPLSINFSISYVNN